MTNTIVVVQDDKQLFLDKVISFGIDHGILTLKRRRELARESADFSQLLCRKYRLNASDIQDVLKAARITYQFTSIALERASQQGNISAAAHLLATTKVGALVGLVLMLIDGAYRRVWKIAQLSYATDRIRRINYFDQQDDLLSMQAVLVWQHTPSMQDAADGLFVGGEGDRVDNLRLVRSSMRNRQCEVALSMRTSHDLDQWLDEIETTAREVTSRGVRKRR